MRPRVTLTYDEDGEFRLTPGGEKNVVCWEGMPDGPYPMVYELVPVCPDCNGTKEVEAPKVSLGTGLVYPVGNDLMTLKPCPSCSEEARIERAACGHAELVETILTWSRAYPESVFPEPPTGEHGRTIDTCSARALRPAFKTLVEMIRAAEGDTDGE